MVRLAQWCLALTLIASLCTRASAQDYPSRPVKVIISITAGAGPDVIARIVGEHLGKLWGQQVVVNQAVPARRRRAPSAARS
jgi:tripartite-type tricarboxylate transporter receptor subunit TctC